MNCNALDFCTFFHFYILFICKWIDPDQNTRHVQLALNRLAACAYSQMMRLPCIGQS